MAACCFQFILPYADYTGVCPEQVREAEEELGRFPNQDAGPGELPPQALLRFSTALDSIARGLRGEGGSNRLKYLMLPGKKSKVHTKLMLAGESTRSSYCEW